ncbi:VOC family protein [Planotetraspora mira]|uniref:VOC family protein n=1 Tax=Planotetraspora mira TaxID=58121 RepID=UPI00194F17DD|nr:VOC family protein [Planotetraspora mira]
MPDHPIGIHHVEIGVGDLDRSLDFYQGLLGLQRAEVPEPPGVRWLSAGSALLKLVETVSGDLGGWINDDLQRGIRHVGFTVGDVDLQADRIRDAGIPFTLPPLDAVGGVRLAFFQDPDGTHLEIIDKHLQYHKVSSPELADRERAAAEARPRTAGPSFGHVAVTVDDLDATLAFYRDTLGYQVIGQISQNQDPRGFLLTYLQAGESVLEVFTFTAPTTPSPWAPEANRHGFRHIAIAVDDVDKARARLVAAGARETVDGLLVDADGIPLRPVDGR